MFAVSTSQAAFKLEGEPKIAMLQLATVNDGGWSEALEYARAKTEEALGLEIAYTENVPEDNSEILRTIDLYVNRGHNIIIGTSWGYGDAFLEAATKYPNVAFVNCAGETNNSVNLESFLRPQLSGLVSRRDRRRPSDAVQEGRLHRRLSAGRGELGPQRLPARARSRWTPRSRWSVSSSTPGTTR